MNAVYSQKPMQHHVKSVSVTSTGRWFSPSTPVSSTNKTDCYDITEILLTVALNTINQTNPNQTKNQIQNGKEI